MSVWLKNGWNGWISRLHLAGELLEHQVLVLHLGDEAGGLEQALAVPNRRWRPSAGRRTASRRAASGVVVAEGVLDVLDQAVVLASGRSGGSRVSAMFSLQRPSPTDEVRVEHLVVVVPAGCWARPRRRSASGFGTGGVAGLLSGPRSGRRCARCRSGTACRSAATLAGTGTGLARLPSTRPVAVTYCGRPRAGPGMKLPYGSAASIGTLSDVLVDELQAELGRRPAP